MPLYISSHLTQCCVSVYTYDGHYVFLLWTTSSPWENHPRCLENKDITCIQKKPSYSSCKINCFVLFYFVLFISHPSSNQSRNFTGTDEGMKVYGMTFQKLPKFSLSTVALCPDSAHSLVHVSVGVWFRACHLASFYLEMMSQLCSWYRVLHS